MCLQHPLLIHHNSYLCSIDSCCPQLSMLIQHPLVHAVPWVCRSLAGRLIWEPPDDISDRGQRRMQKRLLSEYTSLGTPFPLPMPASTGRSRHSRQHAATLLSACGPPRGRLPPLSIDSSWFAKSTIACLPRAANCRRASCVRPVFSMTRSTRGMSESDIRRTSSHHLRVEREGADGRLLLHSEACDFNVFVPRGGQ